jgi:hypothetical protein
MGRLPKFTRDEDRAQHEDSGGDSLSHPEYRAMVMREALKSSSKPDTRTMYLAKQRVDQSLGRSGTTIYIPGARPRRKTV